MRSFLRVFYCFFYTFMYLYNRIAYYVKIFEYIDCYRGPKAKWENETKKKLFNFKI